VQHLDDPVARQRGADLDGGMRCAKGEMRIPSTL
jgi:hypothetical protein